MSEVEQTTAPVTTEAPAATPVAEPVAPSMQAGATGEPSAAEPAAPVGEPASPFPSADEFAWDTWDGTYDSFDERLRPWGEKLHEHYSSTNAAAVERARLQATEDAVQWKDMYNALAMGEEDPRVSQMGTELSQKNAYVQQMEQQLQQQRKAMQDLAETEATRYMGWFESVYKDRLTANPEAAKLALPLLDLESADIPPHEAFEIALLGEKAVDMATKLLQKGNSVELVKEVLQLRTRGQAAPVPTAAPKPTPQPKESSKLVAGAEENAAPPRAKPKKSTKDMPRHEARMAAVDAIFNRFKL